MQRVTEIIEIKVSILIPAFCTVATHTPDSILKAVAFIAEHGDSKENRLLAPNISFDFLSPMWASRSLIRHSWDDRVKMLHKTPFELGMVDTVAKALKDGRIAVEGASRYGPMMEHLIARDDFLTDYSRHLSKVGQSENANECYQPCINGLEHQLDDYDRDYEDIKAGKSDLIFALAYLLNIEIWPRLNSKQNLKLWGVSKNRTYTHIQPAIAGIIDPKAIDDGWIDMMWIIASIVEGVAPPSLIAQHLIKSPKHPATKGFNELG